jgi:carboxymethylenebutenolidase
MSELSAEQTRLAQLWEEHMRHEFQTCSTEDTLATMVEDSYVNHVPVMTGGVGHTELRQFYATHFIPKMPPDMEMTPLSRTIGTDQLVDEMVVRLCSADVGLWLTRRREPWGPPFGSRIKACGQAEDETHATVGRVGPNFGHGHVVLAAALHRTPEGVPIRPPGALPEPTECSH